MLESGELDIHLSERFGFDAGTEAGARYTHYLPEQRARLSLEANSNGRLLPRQVRH